ncbi:general negative regulator of transcription subunit 5 [Trichomonascus vanleenenianus]|uniref:CNOT2/3/5 family protein n=1 Tax=Trichomonascus vanleenenianus TaxID=2268995 RepID=UPI003EC9C94E
MMAARKLQQEMDKVFKRVAEGVQAFDSVYEKVQMSTNQSQKEKLEQDLKREIKKLQRLRDQIKAWIGSNEIKDKKALTEQRKLIETEMERFKACEKEMKTKAFSKEGLSSQRLHPREREKLETSNFVQTELEELERQCEALEAEQETLESTMKKGRKDNTSKSDRISEIEHTLERHKWHITKMETMLRMLENGTLAPDAVNSLQEDIKYYVESNQDVDFAEDEEIYDELNLDEDEDLLADSVQDCRDDGNSLEDLAADATTAPAPVGVIGTASLSAPVAPVVSTAAPVAATAVASTPRKEDRKAAHGSAGPTGVSTPVKGPKQPQPIPVGLSPLPPPKPDPNAPIAPPSSAATTTSTSAATTTAPTPTTTNAPVPGATPSASSTKLAAAPWASELKRAEETKKGQSQTPPPSSPAPTTSTPAPSQQQSQAEVNNMFPPPSSFKLPPGLQDYAVSYLAARKRVGHPPSIGSITKILQSSYLQCPDSLMADRPRYYHPQSPFPTPGYYPQEPMQGLDDELIIQKMDVDTLFYIFYYRQGTYQQYLAARELKNRSWRFHKKFLTWFQRHEEPRVINNDYEEGTYRYFDFEGMWLQRRKTNFKFEYQYLEDEA